MTRLRDKRTGVVVDVDDVTAEALRGSHEPVAATKKAASRKSGGKSTSDE